MKRLLKTLLVSILAFLSVPVAMFGADRQDPDVVIYGATPGGIAAAIAAAKEGQNVLLVEPTHRIGGMVTSGLSHTDFHSFESLTGAYLDFSQRVEAHYAESYGKESAQVRDSFRGTFGEPKVIPLPLLFHHPFLAGCVWPLIGLE